MNEEVIVKTYANMVYKIAYRYTSNPSDAEEVFSETFLKYFKKERAFESEEHRKAWLIRVTINCAKEVLGKRTVWVQINEEHVTDTEERRFEETMELRSIIDQLRPEYRDVVLLFYMEDLSVKRIAEVLGKSENTVKTHLFRARAELRMRLEALG